MKIKSNNKIKQDIKVIVFDVGGVLKIPKYFIKKRKKEFSGIHEEIARKLGIEFDKWFDAIDSLYAKSIVGEITKENFIELVSKRLNVSRKKLVKIVISCYKNGMKRNNIIFRLIKVLRKKYIVGILSDQWPLSRESIFPYKENKNFDFIIISYEVKMRKPNPEIYRLLMKKIHSINKKIIPNEILFIDDKIYNLDPAMELGIKTINFKNNKQFEKELRKLVII